jgi:hypothetical protein
MIRRPRQRRDERGTATAFVVGMAVVLLACAGLVVDGGTALNARMRLADQAKAEDRARVYLVGRGYTIGSVHADQDTVQVSASYHAPTKLLSLVNVNSFTVSASATAEAVTQ